MNLRIRGTIFRMSGFDLLSIRNLMDTMGGGRTGNGRTENS